MNKPFKDEILEKILNIIGMHQEGALLNEIMTDLDLPIPKRTLQRYLLNLKEEGLS